jgi:hypothetical protein
MMIFIQGSWQSGDKFHVPVALFLARSGLLDTLVSANKPKKAAAWRGDLRRSIRVRICWSSAIAGSHDDATAIADYYNAWGFGDQVELCDLAAARPVEHVGESTTGGALEQQSHAFEVAKAERERLLPKAKNAMAFPYASFRNEKQASVAAGLWEIRDKLADEDDWCVDVTNAPALNAGCLLLAGGNLQDQLYGHLAGLVGKSQSDLLRACAKHMVSCGEAAARLDTAQLVFLWGRRSGKLRSPGPHPEHTSGTRALNQIAGALQEKTKAIVVRVGDRGASKPRGYPALSNCIDMTEIHRRDSFVDGGYDAVYGELNPLLVQLYLYAQAARERKRKTVHVGMRSGMLIAIAYLGVPVVYLEEQTSPSRKKWEGFRGKLLNLVRCELTALPSSIGRRVQILAKAGLRDNSNAYTYHLEREFIGRAVNAPEWPEQLFRELFEKLTSVSGPEATEKINEIRGLYETQLRLKVQERRGKARGEHVASYSTEPDDDDNNQKGKAKEKEKERPSERIATATPISADDPVVLRELVTADLNRLLGMVTKWLSHPGFDQRFSWGAAEVDDAIDAPRFAGPLDDALRRDPSFVANAQNQVLYYEVMSKR